MRPCRYKRIFLAFLFLAFLSVMTSAAADSSLTDFPANAGEGDDAARLQRAIDATPGGVLKIPAGVVRLSSPVCITNLCSLELHKNAILRAVRPMDCVLKVDNSVRARLRDADGRNDFGCFVTGGRIDGNGLASCMMLDGFCHYTLRDVQFLNGRRFGLQVNGEKPGCELIAQNLYFRCLLRGLAGNTGVRIMGSDSHYTDIIVTDYTVGFDIARGGANRLTRCHVWGGPLPPAKKGEDREMLKDSVCFRIGETAASTILRDCYADSGKTGFLNFGWETMLFGCCYFNNSRVYHLDDVTIVRQPAGTMLVSGGTFVKSCDKVKIYEGNGRIDWRDMQYSRFGDGRPLPGKCDLDASGSKEIDLGK